MKRGPYKQFCKYGHDTFICGRDSNYVCKECRRIKDRNRVAKPLTDLQKVRAKERRKKWVDKNRERAREIDEKWRELHPREYKNKSLKSAFGISVDVYEQMFNDQEGKCLICGRHRDNFSKDLCVDHNHDTGKIRGLLCVHCNSMFAFFEKYRKAVLGYDKRFN